MAKRKNHQRKQVILPRSVKRLYPQVTHAVDADAPIEVSVHDRDCKDAASLDPTNCALARAAKREFKADGVIIGLSSSYIIKGKEALRFQTPPSVQREIVSFDRHHDFAPGEYYLTPKSPTARMHQPKRASSKGGGHKARRKQHHSAKVRILPKGREGE